MTKRDMSEAVLAAKKAKGLTWAKLAEAVGLGELWLASCGHGENCLDPEAAGTLVPSIDKAAPVRGRVSQLRRSSENQPDPFPPNIVQSHPRQSVVAAASNCPHQSPVRDRRT